MSLVVAVPVSLVTLVPAANSAPAKDRFTLDGNADGWNFTTNVNPTIIVAKGDRVTLQLISIDGMEHIFFVDVSHAGVPPDCRVDKCSNPFGGVFSTSITYKFKVDFPAGTYTYYCSIHPFTMRGAFIVRP